MLPEQFTGLPAGFLIVADGVSQDAGVDYDHRLARSSARSAAA